MAAAIIPLVAAVAPDIIGLIAGLVHRAAPAAEKNGPGTGPVKFGEVFASVIGSLNSAAIAGQIPKGLPGDDVIKVIIQAVVSSMKLAGLLGDAAVAAISPAQSLVLKSGQSVTISVQ